MKVSPKHGLGVPGFNANKKSSSSPHRQMHSQPSNSHVPPPTLPGSMPTLDEMGLLGPTNSFLQVNFFKENDAKYVVYLMINILYFIAGIYSWSFIGQFQRQR